MSRMISLLCILVSTAILLYSYLQVGYWVVAVGLVGLGLVCLIFYYFNISWLYSWMLIILSAAGATGIWLGFAPTLMVIAVLAGLMAWDLDAFHHRLRLFPSNKDTQLIERRHLFWLAIIAIIGFLLSSMAGWFNVQLSFFLTVVLAIIAVLGAMRMITWLRQP